VLQLNSGQGLRGQPDAADEGLGGHDSEQPRGGGGGGGGAKLLRPRLLLLLLLRAVSVDLVHSKSLNTPYCWFKSVQTLGRKGRLRPRGVIIMNFSFFGNWHTSTLFSVKSAKKMKSSVLEILAGAELAQLTEFADC
jgi:hypothetical protein